MNKKNRTIILKAKKHLEQLSIDKIKRIESDGNYSIFYLQDQSSSKFHILLKEIENRIVDKGFFRISRNTIFNLKYFKHLHPHKKYCFVTKDGLEMKVSRRIWPSFKKYLLETK